jgi:DNA-binding transcriptional LysR family regulator
MARPDLESRLGRRFKLRDLHILSEVVRWGSMAKAATHLGLAQPSISEAIAGLEAALKVRLLDRSPRGVEPTIYARTLLKRVDVVFDELKQGMRDLEFLADPTVGHVTIGCPESLAAGFVSTAIDRLLQKNPNLSVDVVLAQTGEQEFRELRDRRVDLALGRLFKPVPDDDIAVEPLCDDGFHVVAGERSRWARKRNLALAELAGERWIFFPEGTLSGSHIEAGFRANHLDLPKRRLTSFSIQLRMHLLATGRFLTVLHDSVLRFNAQRWSLKTLPVDLAIPPIPIAIFTLKHRTLSPVAALVVDELHDVAKSMAELSRAPGIRRVKRSNRLLRSERANP